MATRQHPQVGGDHWLPVFLEADSQRAADDDKVVPDDMSCVETIKCLFFSFYYATAFYGNYRTF